MECLMKVSTLRLTHVIVPVYLKAMVVYLFSVFIPASLVKEAFIFIDT